MFYQNDKALFIARVVINLTISFIAVLSLAVGIALAVVFSGVYFLFALIGWFFCLLSWVFARLLLSYMCDIKLIRNRLYSENNDELQVFLKSRKERSNAYILNEKKAEIEEAKLALEELLKNDMISKTEYERQKKDLIDKEKEINKL